jgi:hypothetical protein
MTHDHKMIGAATHTTKQMIFNGISSIASPFRLGRTETQSMDGTAYGRPSWVAFAVFTVA